MAKGILDKIQNQKKKRREKEYYYRLKFELSGNAKNDLGEYLDEDEFIQALFTENQLKVAIKRALRNPEDLEKIDNIWEKISSMFD